MKENNIMINQLLDQWDCKVRQVTETFESLGPKFAMEAVAPGKNRVIYLLGHLLAIHNHLFEALELGNALYSELNELFLAPQHALNIYPTFEGLLNKWVLVNEILAPRLRELDAADWLSKHAYV